MAEPVILEQSRSMPVDVEGAFVGTLMRGAFEFAAADTGTTATWRWAVHPRSALARPAVALLGTAWHGWARQALKELSSRVVG